MIFVDTGAFLARYLASDRLHESARRAWQRLERQGPRLFTSSHVLDELLTLLGRRASFSFAAERGRRLLTSRKLEILRPREEDEIAAIEFLEKYADQKVSFTDCLSFVLMRRERIEKVFSYDRHFTLAGFTPWPDPP